MVKPWNEIETAALSPRELEALARRTAPEPPAIPEPDGLGHYRLLERLGVGGMGEVFAACDQKLGRTVAIKLMHAKSRAALAQRFIREAQAMARLTHPNVVRVYEIGHTAAGLPYIVMELVDGLTLRDWLEQAKPTRREILEVFEAAGRGLAAVHAAGLIHRDFKPENVMLARDGRVLVMDFGLAREQLLELSSLGLPRTAPDASLEDCTPPQLTRTGALIGTPAYMAPEQFLGARADARSDQFSFCVSLWEAIHGRRPFLGTDLRSLAQAIVDAELPQPASRREQSMPGWLRAVISRGLDRDPGARWPSMNALLDALRGGSRRARARVSFALVGALLLAIGGGAMGAQQVGRGQQRAICSELGARIHDHWSPAAVAELNAKFGGGPSSYAAESWALAQARMDDYAREWSRAREDACLEELDGDPPAWHAEQLRCLEQRRAVFSELVDIWREGEATLAVRAAPAASELAPVSSCLGPDVRARAHAGGAPLPGASTDEREAIAKTRARIARALARAHAGQTEEALEELEAAHARAVELGWAPLEIETRLELGRAQQNHGPAPRASASLRRAYLDATVHGYELLAFEAAASLSIQLGNTEANFEEGLYWAQIAEGLLGRLGLQGTVHAARLYTDLGLVYMRAGEYEKSHALELRALTIYLEHYGEQHPTVASAVNNIAVLHANQGDSRAALPRFLRARDIWERTLGSQHPSLALVWNNIATVELHQGHSERARHAYTRARDIWEGAYGPHHDELSAPIYGLGRVLAAAGEHEEALAHFERSIALISAARGADHPDVSFSLLAIAKIHQERGQPERAIAAVERALEVLEQASSSHWQLAEARYELARLLGPSPDPARRERAEALALEARSGFEAEGRGPWVEAVDAWLANRQSSSANR